MSTAPPPPRSRGPKRPWYLVTALVACWIFGAGALNDGCVAIGFYQGDPVDVRAEAEELTDADDRAAVIALGDRLVETWAAAKDRALPIGVASFLLGVAMVMLSARAMAGRAGSRGALVQVTAVQAALVVANFFLTADVRHAEIAREERLYVARAHQQHPDPRTLEQLERMGHLAVRVFPPAQLVVRTLASALIVLALTRPRSREFFDAMAGELSGR